MRCIDPPRGPSWIIIGPTSHGQLKLGDRRVALHGTNSAPSQLICWSPPKFGKLPPLLLSFPIFKLSVPTPLSLLRIRKSLTGPTLAPQRKDHRARFVPAGGLERRKSGLMCSRRMRTEDLELEEERGRRVGRGIVTDWLVESASHAGDKAAGRGSSTRRAATGWRLG